MSGGWRTLTGRELLEHYIRTGWTDDEIVVECGDQPLLLDESEIPYLRTLPAKRRLREILAEMRGTTPDPGVALDDRRSEMRDELDAVRWSDPRSGCLSVLR